LNPKNKLAGRIGSKLKSLRTQRGLTLQEMAKKMHLSPSFFSRVENGQVMPSIHTLLKIAETLKTDVGVFFQEFEERGYVVSRRGRRRVVLADEGRFDGSPSERRSYDAELLADGMENRFMLPLLVTLVKKDPDIKPYAHGGQEFIYLLEGKVEANLGGDKVMLEEGDTILYDGNIPHRFLSLSKKPARALAVLVAPDRRLRSLAFRIGKRN
jgi:transcriptional regulator with XRE-family HTH domain